MAEPSDDAEANYPWYGIVQDDSLEQGDFFFKFPAYVPHYPEELIRAPDPDSVETDGSEPINVDVDIAFYDVVVLSQSCDLLNRNDLPLSVLVCPVWSLAVAKEHLKSLASKGARNDARKGKLPGVHMLAACDLSAFPLEIQVALFHQVFTIPFTYIKEVARNQHPRLRLLPPYREHLAQAFARFVMRVGLPQDIPDLD